MLSEQGIEGDWQRNRRIHGGRDKAVLILAGEVIEELAKQGFPVYPGALGENLTIAGLNPPSWRTGQRYRVGEEATIELTDLREPCRQLDVFGPAIKDSIYDSACAVGDIHSPLWAHAGFYARVVRPGLIATGAPVVLVSELA